jgi:hypothetical protein
METERKKENKKYSERYKERPKRMEYRTSDNNEGRQVCSLKEMGFGGDARGDVFGGIVEEIPKNNAEEKIHFIVRNINLKKIKKYDIQYTEHHEWF